MKVAKTMKKSKAMKVAMKTTKNFDQAMKKTKAMKKEGTMKTKAMKKNSAMKTTAMKGTKPMKTKAMEDTKSMKKPAHAMTEAKKDGSKPMPDLEPKWLLHHLALKCVASNGPRAITTWDAICAIDSSHEFGIFQVCVKKDWVSLLVWVCGANVLKHWCI